MNTSKSTYISFLKTKTHITKKPKKKRCPNRIVSRRPRMTVKCRYGRWLCGGAGARDSAPRATPPENGPLKAPESRTDVTWNSTENRRLCYVLFNDAPHCARGRAALNLLCRIFFNVRIEFRRAVVELNIMSLFIFHMLLCRILWCETAYTSVSVSIFNVKFVDRKMFGFAGRFWHF